MAERKTTEQFIEDAIALHGDRYDYSKVVYFRSLSTVEIVCRKHGPFMQSPNKHLQGRGCRACGYDAVAESRSIGFEEVIARSRAKHGERYEYDESSYVRTGQRMRIKCHIHGWFSQTPESHILSDSGCRKCSHVKLGLDRAHDTEKFIAKARLAHGDRYSYEHADYKRSGTKIKITCAEHGVFEQVPANHINGYGCPSCAKNGFNVNSGAHLYLLASECRSMIKIGVTKNIRQRILSLSSYTPFTFDLIAHYSGKGRYVKDDEAKFHDSLMSCELSGFNGASEWFRYDHDIVDSIKKRAEALF